MTFAKGHNGFYGEEEGALTSQHFAQKSCGGEAACAVMSARWAEQSFCCVVKRVLMNAQAAARCVADVACAVMSEHKAAQCICEAVHVVVDRRATCQTVVKSQRGVSQQFVFRYQ